MIYRIVFEDNEDIEDYGHIDFYLKEITSPIKLEVGDKIVLSGASFDRVTFYDLRDDDIDEMMEFLIKNSIRESKHLAYFEISDIVYNHEWYNNEAEYNFHGIIILRGK